MFSIAPGLRLWGLFLCPKIYTHKNKKYVYRPLTKMYIHAIIKSR
nr:MAG TPA: hypothetical protein [Caudoviricetes sp.]